MPWAKNSKIFLCFSFLLIRFLKSHHMVFMNWKNPLRSQQMKGPKGQKRGAWGRIPAAKMSEMPLPRMECGKGKDQKGGGQQSTRPVQKIPTLVGQCRRHCGNPQTVSRAVLFQMCNVYRIHQCDKDQDPWSRKCLKEGINIPRTLRHLKSYLFLG